MGYTVRHHSEEFGCPACGAPVYAGDNATSPTTWGPPPNRYLKRTRPRGGRRVRVSLLAAQGISTVGNPSAVLPAGQVGAVSSQTITAPGPYTFAVGSGSLPDGLALDGSGALTGTPTAADGFGASTGPWVTLRTDAPTGITGWNALSPLKVRYAAPPSPE